MKLEDYFDILAPDDIRIKGHRIGIESILYEYIHRVRTAEEIAEEFPTITLEQVYATILYYLHDKEGVGKYITQWLEHGRIARAAQSVSPSLASRLQTMKAQRALPAQVVQ